MESKRVMTLNKLYLSMLTIIFVLAYIVFVTVSEFNWVQDLLFLLSFITLYLIFVVLILEIKKAFFFLDTLLVAPSEKKEMKEIEITDPMVEEVVNHITIEAPKPVKKEKKYKFYGSTDAKTYHLEKCRFSGMIKPKYLVQKNKPDYFKTNKFHPCGNCKPNKK